MQPINRTCWPVVKHMLGDVCGRVVWRESEVLRFATDQDKAEMHLRKQQIKRSQHVQKQKRVPSESRYNLPNDLCWNSYTSSNLFWHEVTLQSLAGDGHPGLIGLIHTRYLHSLTGWLYLLGAYGDASARDKDGAGGVRMESAASLGCTVPPLLRSVRLMR